ncbi:MAG: fumarylacetoacetate hydrolase family protein [Chloroflexota bacterium]
MPDLQLCVFELDGAERLGALRGEAVYDLSRLVPRWTSLDALLADSLANIRATLTGIAWRNAPHHPLEQVQLKTPLGGQEVWAAGVTYDRSRQARTEESHAPDVYDRVYTAERPELFLKAMRSRTSGPGEPVAIRSDSHWDVPEAEIAIVANAHMELVGFTAANDMSSREIEGQNPLYVPQAKIYSYCLALGPAITPCWEVRDPHALRIQLAIHRAGAVTFAGTTSTASMARPFAELLAYLGRDNSFPGGVILSTGTGIVPPDAFTLEAGDVVEITIDEIGTLRNPVIRLPE